MITQKDFEFKWLTNQSPKASVQMIDIFSISTDTDICRFKTGDYLHFQIICRYIQGWEPYFFLIYRPQAFSEEQIIGKIDHFL